jgi:hypothetical protein
VHKIRQIEQLFARQIPAGALEVWQPYETEGHVALRLWNRYFTRKRDQGSRPAVPFSPVIDPAGILARACDQGVVHLEDNEVQYYEAIYPKPGKIKYAFSFVSMTLWLNILS